MHYNVLSWKTMNHNDDPSPCHVGPTGASRLPRGEGEKEERTDTCPCHLLKNTKTIVIKLHQNGCKKLSWWSPLVMSLPPSGKYLKVTRKKVQRLNIYITANKSKGPAPMYMSPLCGTWLPSLEAGFVYHDPGVIVFTVHGTLFQDCTPGTEAMRLKNEVTGVQKCTENTWLNLSHSMPQ